MKDSSSNNTHKLGQALIFRGKAGFLQIRRSIRNRFDRELKQHKFSDQLKAFTVIAESKTPLWTESEPEEQYLLAGKVENLRLVVKRLNGLEIPAGEIFSFWQQVGRASRLNGFVVGRELREGCIIPSVGGGLCQISNALYDAALNAGFEIIERHSHTQVIKGSLAEKGRDATVFWNYVDLRFRSVNAFRIEAVLGKDHLSVKFKSRNKPPKLIQINKNGLNQTAVSSAQSPNSCATCGIESCFRNMESSLDESFGKTAFLADEFSPEFDKYIQQTRTKKDLLLIPLDGKRFRKANYAWSKNGFAQTNQSFFVTAVRSYKSRQLASQGAARQKNLLAMYEKLALDYAKKLKYDDLHLVVQQNLLPFLWKSGVLGGRTFDVLMNALPMAEIQKRLDYAYSINPDSPTLGDFRADEDLLKAETSALAAAEKIITPHRDIASLFGVRAELLDWEIPENKKLNKAKNEKPTIVFPASTVGRKGCYELREAIRGMDLKLLTLGGEIEGKDFWKGFDVEKGGADWPQKADVVVLPAFVEHKPRRLLLAVSKGIPVIASSACGLGDIAGVKEVKAGNVADLRAAIEKAARLDFPRQKPGQN
jgi:hypothetical protein